MIRTKRTVTKILNNGIMVNLHRSPNRYSGDSRYIIEAIRPDGSLVTLMSAPNRVKAFHMYRSLKLVA